MTVAQVLVSQRSFAGARSSNEDCIGVERCGQHWCLVLCDGAGGHRDGEVAARLAVDRVLQGFRSRPPVDARDLSELLLDAHDAVVAGQRVRGGDEAGRPMHATVVVLLVNAGSGQALWGHVGDSRLYLSRAGQVTAMTRDDSVLQWMLDSGVIDEARGRAVANRGPLMAALGADHEIEPHVSGPFELGESDAFLLCSDGWWDGLDEAHIGAALGQAGSPDQWLDAMAAMTERRRDPKQDNYSAVACWIRGVTAAAVSEPAGA